MFVAMLVFTHNRCNGVLYLRGNKIGHGSHESCLSASDVMIYDLRHIQEACHHVDGCGWSICMDRSRSVRWWCLPLDKVEAYTRGVELIGPRFDNQLGVQEACAVTVRFLHMVRVA